LFTTLKYLLSLVKRALPHVMKQQQRIATKLRLPEFTHLRVKEFFSVAFISLLA